MIPERKYTKQVGFFVTQKMMDDFAELSRRKKRTMADLAREAFEWVLNKYKEDIKHENS